MPWPDRSRRLVPLTGSQNVSPLLCEPSTRRPSGSATMSVTSLSDMPASRTGSKYLNAWPSNDARPYAGSDPNGPLAHQLLPSGVTATALMPTGSPGAGGQKTGGVPVNGEQDLWTQPFSQKLTTPLVPQNWKPKLYWYALPPRWNQPVPDCGSGDPSACTPEFSAT